MMEKNVYIANIQKMCVHDGPGIRTTVFFMGCPLRCKWCQNPENLEAKPVILFNREQCVLCGACVQACKERGNRIEGEKLSIQRSRCVGCGECVKQCLTEARSLCGKKMGVQELYEEVMKDEIFFRTSGGGITVSGGEPSLYPEYMNALLGKFKESGIHTTMETCGFCRKEALDKFKDSVDLFLFDLKTYTSGTHIKWTGQDNVLINENLKYLLQEKKRVIIRIPLIPGVNDGEEFEKMMKFLKELRGIRQVHILPFHQIGSSKYKTSDRNYEMEETDECSDEIAKHCVGTAKRYGFEVNEGGWDTV